MTEVPDLQAELARLRDDVDDLLAVSDLDSSGVPAGPSPQTAKDQSRDLAHVWYALTAKQAADAWEVLTAWVDWLIARYGLDEAVPACWYRHGAFVDELDALRAAWTDAYLSPSASPSDACRWLAHLAGSTARIREWDRYGCAAGAHHDDDPLTFSSAALDDRLTFVQADVAARMPTMDAHIRGTSADGGANAGPWDGSGDLPGDDLAL